MKGFKSNLSSFICASTIMEDSMWYVLHCGCGDRDHSALINIDCDDGTIWLNFYKDLAYFPPYYVGPIGKLWHRIRATIRLLFTGYIEVNESMLMVDEDHIDNLIDALIESRNYLAIRYKNQEDKKNVENNIKQS